MVWLHLEKGDKQEVKLELLKAECSSDLIYYNKKWYRSSSCQGDLVILK